MHDLTNAMNNHFHPSVACVMKSEATMLSPEACSLPLENVSSTGLAVVFEINGEANGRIAFVFSNAPAAGRRFLEITVGVIEEEHLDEACQEIANQSLGRLLGSISEEGARLEITYPGEIMPLSNLRMEMPGARIIAATQSDKLGNFLIYATLSSQPDTPEEALPESQEEPTRPTRVLIVDDSPVMCAFLEKIFSENGYEVAGVAADGLQAMEMFERCSPDLVTLDIVMPGMKGTEVLKAIMGKHPEAAIVMASSVSDARTVMQCLKMGARRYIIKPYDKTAVLSAVEKALGMRGDKND